ncbi:MAG: tRNA (adenosine(37)-N6)-threonylcarbamoyltransferase complex dimerization subunit type 1 TsaB [Ferrovibrio sp.]|uniref:tRNA (adenosine(37)-N6)-threonylcarbamoyltransferase complex dimerization subunit type 1 TsaB n=1 Tax=Ferrovibrio sp. TaxID=1917215 RepID=UPI0026169000|nr:tRNA (adenosine(37)-N6)-threonylcarbamoyltransferase complex dimerization subunit type 1 TsaB [Ferrovibrio sp.]MCW0233706.1 tRNA (adenosine(37)-N6)-threonylcarbamoyltransferase complex dimerization subunit type 1 TsaB [Ferrovibrio sp.]
MKLLGIDTALNACSVAIIDGDATLATVVSAGGKGNAERLLPALEQARQQAGIQLADLDGIAATIGPGSFTGIRTALATARALGLALGKPVWGITTTEVLATAAAQPGLPTVAVIDARRDEVYIQCFAAAASGPGAALTEPQLLGIAAAVAILPQGPAVLVGSGSALLQDAARRDDLHLSLQSPDPDPALVARLAAARPRPLMAPAPLYIRPPDAKLPTASPAVTQPAARLTLNIRACGVESAAVLAALHADGFAGHGEVWTAASLRDLLAMPGALALLALDDGDQPAGFILLRQAADEAEIITLAVRPRLRRLGVARRLLLVGLDKLAGRGAPHCFLEVAEDNVAARALYATAGFTEIGRRPGYYRDPAGRQHDAIVMRT